MNRPLLLLVLSFVVISLLNFAMPVFEKEAQLAQRTKAQYSSVLAASEFQLVGLMRDILDNQVFLQNLNWGLKHSVVKSLEGALRKSELDELSIFDANCQTIAKAQIGKSLVDQCSAYSESGKKLEHLIWTESAGTPSVGIILPLENSNKETFYLAGFVRIDADWLQLHPDLAQNMRRLDAKITTTKKLNSGLVLVKEGQIAKDNFAAALVTNSVLLKLAPSYAYNTVMPLTKQLRIYLIFLALAIAGYVWWLMRQRDNRQVTIAAMAESHAKEIVELTERYDALADQHMILDGQFKQTKNALDQNRLKVDAAAYNASLANQVDAGGQEFLTKIEDIQSKVEDASDILMHGLNRSAQTLSTFMNHWKNEITNRGARRFFRALAETPTTNGTMLDEQIQKLMEISSHLATQTVSLSMNSQHVIHDLTAIKQLAEHWQQLATGTASDASPTSLLDVMLNAQKLVKLNQKHAFLIFQNQIDFNQVTSLKSAPKTVWVSALFHLYLTAIDLAKIIHDGPIKLTTHLKQNDQQQTLIVSYQTDADSDISAAKLLHWPDSAEKNLQLASALLKKHRIACQKIPPIKGILALGMSWQVAPEVLPLKPQNGPKEVSTPI
jgi:hypothetical protein